MTKYTARDLTLNRRKEVARLRERGFSLDAIHETIKQNPKVRNKDGKAWSRTVIGDDLRYFSEMWQQEISHSVNQLKAEHLNKIRLVQQQASEANDWALFLKAVTEEIKLTGTGAPLKVDINIVSRLVMAIEATGRDANPVLEAMLIHLESSNETLIDE